MSQTPQPPLGGRYELRRQLATTPAARVYLAQDLELGRPVAIKVLGPELARDPQIVERFRRAANAAAAVHDPRIVAIYDWGEDQGAVYVAMEYVDGASLAETLADTGRLGTAPTINMGVRVAESLDVAHRAGLVHGSLKPRDVLLARDGAVKVADFGTATAGLAALAGPVSTATYDSPEQLQGMAADSRSDLYALGVVLYEAITGAPPFTGPDAVTITQRKLSERVIPPSVAMPSIPPGFDAIIDRLLERDPAHRYTSGADVAADLIRLGETAQIPIVDPTVALPTVAAAPAAAAAVARPPEEEKKKRSATGWIVAAIILLVLAIGGLVAYAVTQSSDSKAELVDVPPVIGSRVAAASDALRAAGLSPSTQNESSDLFGEGIVFEQAPVAGTQARKGSVVVIKVSTGPATTTSTSTSSTSTSSTSTSTTTSTTSTTTTTITTPPPT
jgi:eukaryotic-like serine/threonine-protein kinase